MKVKISVLIFIFIIPFVLSAKDNLEGLSFGVDGGILFAGNSEKFSVSAAGSKELNLDISTFITLGAFGRYGITDNFSFEGGVSQSYASDIKFIIFRYEAIYMFNPYEENRYYIKFGGVRSEASASFFNEAGDFKSSNGIIYTAGMEMGYSDMPINISVSYLHLKNEFEKKWPWTGDEFFDLSGLLIKGMINFYF